MVWPPGGLCRQGLGSHVSERVVAGEYMKIPFVPCIFFLLSCVFIVGGDVMGKGAAGDDGCSDILPTHRSLMSLSRFKFRNYDFPSV